MVNAYRISKTPLETKTPTEIKKTIEFPTVSFLLDSVEILILDFQGLLFNIFDFFSFIVLELIFSCCYGNSDILLFCLIYPFLEYPNLYFFAIYYQNRYAMRTCVYVLVSVIKMKWGVITIVAQWCTINIWYLCNIWRNWLL